MPPAAARSACARKWTKEETGRGTYQIVITEIPWLVQKSRLIERMAELLNEKKLPLVDDVRDELTEDVRIVIEPKSRTVDAGMLMELLFKLTELESRIPLNMNVLSKGKVPKVMDLAEVLKEWLDHRREVLIRRSKHRLAQIEHRLEVLGGLLVAYLNLDKVIKIIRNEDEPKPVLMKTFKITDVQADAILNMRLRNLRKLEEMEIRTEDKELRSGEGRPREAAAVREGAVGDGRRPDQGGSREVRTRRRRSASAAPTSPKRPSTTRRRSKRRWWCASRSPSWCRRRAGSARCAATRPTLSGHRVQGRRRAEVRVPGRDHVEDPGVRRPTAASTRIDAAQAAGRARPRRAGAALRRHGAGRRAGGGVPLSGRPQVPGGEHDRPRLRRGRGRVSRQHAQGQAGAQRQGAGRGRARSRRSRANWSRRSARTARW